MMLELRGEGGAELPSTTFRRRSDCDPKVPSGKSSSHLTHPRVNMPPTTRAALAALPSPPKPLPRPQHNPFICTSCLLRPPNRTFTSTPTLPKKSASNPRSARKTPKVSSPTVSRHVPDNAATSNRDAEIDPYDHSTLQSGITKALTRLQDALTKTKDAGRITPEILESLPVELTTKDNTSPAPGSTPPKSTKQTLRLGDLASVVPKGGRLLQIYAAEASHVKPLLSAVQASEHSLTPEAPKPDDPNPLCISVPIPPVTAETRQQAVKEAKACLEKANMEIRNARGDAQKRFRRMDIEKLVVVDELRKAHKGMEEVVKKGMEEAKRVFDGAVKGLER